MYMYDHLSSNIITNDHTRSHRDSPDSPKGNSGYPPRTPRYTQGSLRTPQRPRRTQKLRPLAPLAPRLQPLSLNCSGGIAKRVHHAYIYIYVCIYIHTRNYTPAIASALFPTGSRRDPWSIQWDPRFADQNNYGPGPKKQVSNKC